MCVCVCVFYFTYYRVYGNDKMWDRAAPGTICENRRDLIRIKNCGEVSPNILSFAEWAYSQRTF